MNKKQIFAISFFIGGTFFLGSGFSNLLKLSNYDSWISLLLGIFLGIGVIYLLQLIKQKESEGIQKYKILNKIIFFLYNLFLYSQIIFVFQTFASSFFLVKSANWFITLPIPFIIYKISKSGINTIGKISEIFLPIVVFILLLGFAGIIRHFDISNFTPILATNPTNIFEGALLVMTYSTVPFFVFLNTPLKENKFIKGYLSSQIVIFIYAILIIGILGPNLMQMYRYPEYMILKEIKLFDFVEKVENIVSIAWLFNLFVLLSMTGYNLKETLPKKKNNILFALLLFIMYIVPLFESYFYSKELILYHTLPYIFLGIEIILICITLFSYKKKR